MFKEITIDGKRITYTPESLFAVEVGRGAKGSYRRRYTFPGDPARAVFYYRCINIGNGYKKRLRMLTASKGREVIARATS